MSEGPKLRLPAPLAAVVVSVGLTGCSVFGIGFGGDGAAGGGGVETDPATATVIVTTEQVGCCYMEGSLRFAKLEGPTTLDWDVDDGSGRDPVDHKDPFIIGVQTHTVEPGNYTLTEWEEVCDGNCGYLDGPTNHCTLEFTAQPGQILRIRVSFTIPNPCAATLQQG